MTVVLMTVPIINLMISSDQYGGGDYCDDGDDNGGDDLILSSDQYGGWHRRGRSSL